MFCSALYTVQIFQNQSKVNSYGPGFQTPSRLIRKLSRLGDLLLFLRHGHKSSVRGPGNILYTVQIFQNQSKVNSYGT